MPRAIPPFLVRGLTYPLHRLRTGVDAQGAAQFLESIQWKDSAQIEAYQDRRLRELVAAVGSTVPYFRDAFAAAGIDPSRFGGLSDLHRIPLLDKDIIRAEGTRMQIPGASAKDLKPNSTGGSSGKNLHFFHDRATRSGIMATQLVNWRWVGAGDGRPIAYLWGSPIESDRARALAGRFKNTLQNVLYLSCFGLNEAMIEDYEAQIRSFRPRVLIGYPSALSVFARSMEARQRGPLPLQSVICTSEVLLPEEREVIERALGAPVFNRYGCREVGDIAHECDCHQGLHVNSGRMIVELVPVDGTDEKEVVVTDLDNRTMPFLRYRMGDLAEWSGSACACGRGLPLFTEVRGRKFDLIQAPNGATLPGTFWTHLFRSIPGVLAFQVVQTQRDHLRILLVPEGTLPDTSLAWFQEEIAKLAGRELTVGFERVPEIPPHASGKRRFVVSEVKP